MASDEPREAKRWRLAKLHLEYARDAIPVSTGQPPGTGGPQELALLAQLAHRLDTDALEDALETLWALGDLGNCRGGFWAELRKAADYMDLADRRAALRERMHAALRSTAK